MQTAAHLMHAQKYRSAVSHNDSKEERSTVVPALFSRLGRKTDTPCQFVKPHCFYRFMLVV